MEIIEEEYVDPHDLEPALFKLTDEKRIILEKRGLFPGPDGQIDDRYYTTRRNIKRRSHLKAITSILQLIEMPCLEMERLLFEKDSMQAIPVVFYDNTETWSNSFGCYPYFYDVDPFCLEPYIAKYVRAINRCGMQTFYSCDGWHKRASKSKELVILFRERYSLIWHKLICGLLDVDKNSCWEYECNGLLLVARIRLPRDDERKLIIYTDLLSAANTFVEKSDFCRDLKLYIAHNSNDREMDYLSNKEVEKKLSSYIDTYMCRIIQKEDI